MVRVTGASNAAQVTGRIVSGPPARRAPYVPTAFAHLPGRTSICVTDPGAVDGATVSVNTEAAKPIWDAMKNDTAWPPTGGTGGEQPLLKTAPEQIRVNVLNGTAEKGKAKQVAKELRKQGYVVELVDNAETSDVALSSLAEPIEERDFAAQAAIPVREQPGIWLVEWGQVAVTGPAAIAHGEGEEHTRSALGW